MDVVCVLWSTRDSDIQAKENTDIRVDLEHQAAKTCLLLFKVGTPFFSYVQQKIDPDPTIFGDADPDPDPGKKGTIVQRPKKNAQFFKV